MTTIQQIAQPLMEAQRVIAAAVKRLGLEPVIYLSDRPVDEYAPDAPLPPLGEGTLVRISLERTQDAPPHLGVPDEWRSRVRALTAYLKDNRGQYRLFEDGSGEIVLTAPHGEVCVAQFSSLVDLPAIDPGNLPTLEAINEQQPAIPGLRMSGM